MSEIKLTADSGGGSVSFKGPATTTSNAAVQLTLPVDDGSADQYLKTNGSGTLSWATVTTDPTTTSGTNNFTVADGNLVIATSGHGIDFSATAGTGTSELFDDYEEGTWTAGVYHQGVDNGSGRYTKIGRVVFAHFRFQLQNAVGNNNHQSIAGLPFTIKDATPRGSVARGYQTYNSQGGPLYEPSPNTTQVYLYTNTGSNINAADLGTTWLSGTIIYETD